MSVPDSAFMYDELCIESCSMCNRHCPTCLRQSYPDRDAVGFRLTGATFLPTTTFERVIDEAVEMGFRGMVNLQFWNEPFMDARLPDLCRYAKDKGAFRSVKFCSNADLVTPDKARSVDGLVDEIVFALYGPVGGDDIGYRRGEREAEIRSWFATTGLTFLGPHMTTHFSPRQEVRDLIAANIDRPCIPESRNRMIIDHRGEMLLCCEDIIGEWDLGSVEEHSVPDLWYSDKHVEILATLAVPGGRRTYAHCQSCPRR